MTSHTLKILPQYYDAILHKEKTFELRKNDRNFQIGDTIRLRKWNGEQFFGPYLEKKIVYILKNVDGLEPDYCILGIEDTRSQLYGGWWTP